MTRSLSAAKRNALPASAFAYPSRRAFPMPTRAQARAVGMSNAQRLGLIRNAQARAAQSHTAGSIATVRRVGRARTTAAEVPSLHNGATATRRTRTRRTRRTRR